MGINYNGHLQTLKRDFQKGRLTFYLGAGVSKPSGLPSWEELVLSLYFHTLNDDIFVSELRPYPNYLFALAEWVLQQKNEPLEIIVRKIKDWWQDKHAFVEKMRVTLYAGLGRQDIAGPIDGLSNELMDQNATLRAIIECCKKTIPGNSGLSAIITYNYDNLVELCLDADRNIKDNFQVISQNYQKLIAGKIPIYHVHGYIPYQDEPVAYKDIIFSEEQYNRAFQDQFFWGNNVQVNQLTNTTGLMIGLSLSDRNTRRILDSIQQQPFVLNNYILMQRPVYKKIDENSDIIAEIRSRAEKYAAKFPKSRMSLSTKEPGQVQQILDQIYKVDALDYENGFNSLGLNLITFDEFNEIPEILKEISN